jgi:hypothetical protein
MDKELKEKINVLKALEKVMGNVKSQELIEKREEIIDSISKTGITKEECKLLNDFQIPVTILSYIFPKNNKKFKDLETKEKKSKTKK